jgi:hypothetical protein
VHPNQHPFWPPPRRLSSPRSGSRSAPIPFGLLARQYQKLSLVTARLVSDVERAHSTFSRIADSQLASRQETLAHVLDPRPIANSQIASQRKSMFYVLDVRRFQHNLHRLLICNCILLTAHHPRSVERLLPTLSPCQGTEGPLASLRIRPNSLCTSNPLPIVAIPNPHACEPLRRRQDPLDSGDP